MLDTQFYNGFVFAEYHYSRYHTNDYTKGTGVRKHFFGRMVSGKARLVTDEVNLSLMSGDVFYIPKNLKYRSFWYPEDNEILTFHSLGFELFPLEDNQRYQLQKLECSKSELELFDEICSNVKVSAENIGRLYMFLGLISKRMQLCDVKNESVVSGKALDFMRAQNDYTIKDVAEYCGISESGIYAMFRRVFGKTPIEVKHSIVAKKAVELLTRTDLSVEEICNRLNFSSSAYFRKIIREQTGKTPSQIRKGKA